MYDNLFLLARSTSGGALETIGDLISALISALITLLMFCSPAIIAGIIFGAITQSIIKSKGYRENWFWWGFFFEIFAVIAAIIKPVAPDYYSTSPSQSNKGRSYSPTSSGGGGVSASNNGWTCRKCGRVNPNYYGTCACGADRDANKEAEEKEVKEKKEIENMDKLLKYKQMLDAGIMTQEEFDKKKEDLM